MPGAGFVAGIVAKLLGATGFSFLDRVLGHLERRADSETERKRIAAGREANANTTASNVVMAGMQHKAFWIPWLMAAVPLAAWFAWGIADSLFNGLLPNVATLPPQLKEYADIVWGNIFYVGGGVAGVQIVAATTSAILGRK